MTASPWAYQFRLYDGASTDGRPIWPETATFGHDALMNGQAVLTFHAGDDGSGLQGSTLGAEFPETVLRVFHVDSPSGRPIWVGVAIASSLSTQGRGRVAVTFEHAWQHILRRRAVFAAAYATTDYNTGADNIALGIMRAQIGATPTVPAGHPGTRTDYGAFSTAVAADNSPALAPSRRHITQAGTVLLDVINELAEAADLAPVLTDDLAGTFTLDVDHPFAENDRTASAIFGQYHGNLARFELATDRSALANVWFVEGKTANSPQIASDATSITAWGEFEAYAQRPEDSSVNAYLLQTATDLRDGYAEARVSYKAELIGVSGSAWITDFAWRDTIRIEEAIFGLYIEQTVTAWEVRVERGCVRSVDVVLGVPKAPDLMRHVAGYVGVPGPRLGGSPWRNRRQA